MMLAEGCRPPEGRRALEACGARSGQGRLHAAALSLTGVCPMALHRGAAIGPGWGGKGGKGEKEIESRVRSSGICRREVPKKA